MRKLPLLIVAVSLISVAHPSFTQLAKNEIKADAFIKYITVADPYTEWQTWPDKGKAPHGHGIFITTHVNRSAFKSITEKKGMADGSIIVVENYTADKTLAGLTTMYKLGGYNPEAGDWYWIEATPTGRVLRFGKAQPCIDCHSAQAGNDYIWTGKAVKGRYNKTAPEAGEGPLG